MLLNQVEWSEDRNYRTGTEDEPFQFYLKALANSSSSFDLLLGYFSSAAINLLSVGFAKFLSSGGTMRIIVNDILSEKDKEAVRKGLGKPEFSNIYDLTYIKRSKEILDEYGQHFFECLAWLIANEKIQLKIIKPKDGKGIAHYKSGIFDDGTNQVSFTGSCNFTAYGLAENLEEITTFLSWENGRSNKQIKSQRKPFDEIFEGKSKVVEFVDVEDIKVEIRNEFGNKDINELIIQEKDLLKKKKLLHENPKVKKVINKVEEGIAGYIREPSICFFIIFF